MHVKWYSAALTNKLAILSQIMDHISTKNYKTCMTPLVKSSYMHNSSITISKRFKI